MAKTERNASNWSRLTNNLEIRQNTISSAFTIRDLLRKHIIFFLFRQELRIEKGEPTKGMIILNLFATALLA